MFSPHERFFRVDRLCTRLVASTLIGLCALASTASPLPTQRAYTLTDLGTLPNGFRPTPQGINANGQVAGYVRIGAASRNHAFLFTDGAGLVDLGSLGGNTATAYGLNDAGVVVGYAASRFGEDIYRAFVYTADQGMTDIGTLGGDISFAFGVSNAGQVCGYSEPGFGPFHAFRYTITTGVMEDLGDLGGGYSYGYGINNRGDVAGASYINATQYRAFVYRDNGPMTSLGTLGGNSQANAVNDAGTVVGFFVTSGSDSHAFVYTAGAGLRDLGTLGGSRSNATAVNARGEIVGYATDAQERERAFVVRGGVLEDLNRFLAEPDRANWVLTAAWGINARGQIVGVGTRNGVFRAFRLTPTRFGNETTVR